MTDLPTQPTPTRMPTHVARQRLAEVVEDVAFRNLRVIVTHYGRDRAAIVSVADLARLEQLEAKAGPAKRRRPK